jgi:hypothetical protein
MIATLADALNDVLLSDPAQLTSLARRASTDEHMRAGATAGLMLRPALLGEAEQDRLEGDLATLTDLLMSLPDRLYGGDADRMAETLGFPPVQRAAIEATWHDDAVVLSRTDLMRTADGFRALEVNLHSSLGGLDSGPWHRAFLGVPPVADFLAAHRLTYIDPLDGVAGALRAAARERGLGAFPRVAIVDWPSSYPALEARLKRLARLLSARGFDAFACHAGQLAARDGRLHAGGRAVDILYRIFVLDHVSENPALLAPVLAAHRSGNLVLAMSFRAELVGNKGALALLCDPAHAHAFTAAERAVVARTIPWTRMVTHALDLGGRRREDLILKPVGGYGARGIVAGWTAGDAAWDAAVAAATGRPWILQERIRPLPEVVPVLSGDGAALCEVDVNWGAFTVGGRYSGMMIRAVPSHGPALISTSSGALIGACFFPRSGDAAPRPPGIPRPRRSIG